MSYVCCYDPAGSSAYEKRVLSQVVLYWCYVVPFSLAMIEIDVFALKMRGAILQGTLESFWKVIS